MPVVVGLNDREFRENPRRQLRGAFRGVGREIFAAIRRGADDAVRRAAETEQRGVDPARTEVGAEDFSRGLDGKFIRASAEIDFPALGAENGVLRLPAVRQTGQQPETDSLIGVNGLDGQSQPRVSKSAELPQGGHHDGAIAAGGFLGTVLGRHFRQDETGERFLDFEREQAHAGRFARPGAMSKPGLIWKSLMELNGYCPTGVFCINQYIWMMIPLAAAYRLAKFNIDTRQTTGFIGIPTPMTGMALASFAWMSYTLGHSGNIWILQKPLIDLSGLFSNYYVWLYMPLVASYMMISEIPMLSLKRVKNDPLGKYKMILLVMTVPCLLFGSTGVIVYYFGYILVSFLSNFAVKSINQ